eukprot:m.134795 g.134795  ORF g.134795 m.134795 type:complete len:506 (+) comp13965_c0_seq5:77-1594(+)
MTYTSWVSGDGQIIYRRRPTTTYQPPSRKKERKIQASKKGVATPILFATMVDRVQRVVFGAEGFEQAIGNALRDDGVVVLTDVFSTELCNEVIQGFADGLHTINPAIQTNGSDVGFDANNMPPGGFVGMIQSLASNFPAIWKIRGHEHWRKIFKAAYKPFRPEGTDLDAMFTSIDGEVLRPPKAPFATAKTADWAHFDQTRSDDTFHCVQGQAVLTDASDKCTACFRCTRGSHSKFREILHATGGQLGLEGDWHKLKPEDYKVAQGIVPYPDEFQAPIHTPKGSVILWTSTTLHSSINPTQPLTRPHDMQTPDGKWRLWRCVIFVCYRLRSDVDDPETHTKRLITAYQHNRVTNHWGSWLFPKRPSGFARYRKYVGRMGAFLKDPHLVYEKQPELKPEQTPELLALLTGQAPSSLPEGATTADYYQPQRPDLEPMSKAGKRATKTKATTTKAKTATKAGSAKTKAAARSSAAASAATADCPPPKKEKKKGSTAKPKLNLKPRAKR